MYEHRGTFRYMYGLLGILAVGALLWLPTLALDHVRVDRVEVPQPPPTASTSAGEMQERLGTPAGSVPGSQVNASLPGVCDVYQGRTWIVLLCH